MELTCRYWERLSTGLSGLPNSVSGVLKYCMHLTSYSSFIDTEREGRGGREGKEGGRERESE